jgi:hypothetical protein
MHHFPQLKRADPAKDRRVNIFNGTHSGNVETSPGAAPRQAAD